MFCQSSVTHHLLSGSSPVTWQLYRLCQAWLCAAKCKIAASQGSGPAERRAELQEGAKMVLRAKEGFETARDMARVKDCLYLLARLYHTLNLTQERNMAAGQYKKLEDLYPVKTRITMDCIV